MGRAFTILQNMQLPTQPKKDRGLLSDTMNAINKSFTDFLESKLWSGSSYTSLDLSVLFVEFSEYDKEKGSLPTIDFPNRIAVSLLDRTCLCIIPNGLLEHLTERYLKLV